LKTNQPSLKIPNDATPKTSPLPLNLVLLITARTEEANITSTIDSCKFGDTEGGCVVDTTVTEAE